MRTSQLVLLILIALNSTAAQAEAPAYYPGDGPIPAPVTTGDLQAPPPVTSGKADSGSGTRFDTVLGGTNRAQILTPGSRRNETLMQYTETVPYPKVSHVTINGKDYQYIDRDAPADGYPKEQNKWIYGGIPTVKVLSRYFVILAAVVSTVLMAFGAFGVSLGHENAGSKITFCAGGLMLLFMAFTIWKVAQANMVNYNEGDPVDGINPKLARQILLPDAMPRQSSPPVPDLPRRSGVPVAPLSGN